MAEQHMLYQYCNSLSYTGSRSTHLSYTCSRRSYICSSVTYCSGSTYLSSTCLSYTSSSNTCSSSGCSSSTDSSSTYSSRGPPRIPYSLFSTVDCYFFFYHHEIPRCLLVCAPGPIVGWTTANAPPLITPLTAISCLWPTERAVAFAFALALHEQLSGLGGCYTLGWSTS